MDGVTHFYRWLMRCVDHSTPVGRLARYVRKDSPPDITLQQLRRATRHTRFEQDFREASAAYRSMRRNPAVRRARAGAPTHV